MFKNVEVEVDVYEALDELSDQEIEDYINEERKSLARKRNVSDEWTEEDYDDLMHSYFQHKFDLKKLINMIGKENIKL